MRHSIMTEKIARRGVRVPEEYLADALHQILVRDAASIPAKSLRADDTIAALRRWIDTGEPHTSHQGFPVVDAQGHLLGVVTRRQFLDPKADPAAPVSSLIRRHPVIVYDDSTLREAVDHMVNHGVGRLPVVSRADPSQLLGVITRSDLLEANRRRLDETTRPTRSLRLFSRKRQGQ